MNAIGAIKLSIDTATMVWKMYLEDLTDAEMLKRPCPGCNHINWQLGHLIVSENEMLGWAGGPVVPLPDGFKERYTNDTAASDDPKTFCMKAELLKVFEQQRAATLAGLEKVSEADLDKPTGIEWAPTVATLYSLQGGHYLMHAGQWAVVRRMQGRKPLF